MLQLIKDLPEHVAAIHAAGEVKRRDYENMVVPIFDEFVSAGNDINYLLILETEGSNFTPAVCWRDLKLMLKYYGNWNKIAVVTDKSGIEWFTDVFKFVVPAETMSFTLDKLDEAIKWVSEK